MTPTLEITTVELRVRDLARSLAFYVDQCGLVVRQQGGGRAALATSPDSPVLLIMEEHATAPPPPPDAAGLFHAALVLPSAGALGRWLQFAASRGVEFAGMSDHGVSEAIYFSDPDDNGLEFYADRPRPEWPFQAGELAMITKPVDVPRLLAAAGPPTSQPLAGARWGHVHLRVTDLERSGAFFRTTLGLEVTQRSFPGALFLAADGYHHHVGLNVWGRPRRPQLPAVTGLTRVVFARAGASTTLDIVDPDGMTLQISPLGAAAATQR